jgi:hypothetical protein
MIGPDAPAAEDEFADTGNRADLYRPGSAERLASYEGGPIAGRLALKGLRNILLLSRVAYARRRSSTTEGLLEVVNVVAHPLGEAANRGAGDDFDVRGGRGRILRGVQPSLEDSVDERLMTRNRQ